MTTVPAKPQAPPRTPLPLSSSSYKSHNNKQYKITKQKKNVKYKWKLLLQQLCCNFEPNMSPLSLSLFPPQLLLLYCSLLPTSFHFMRFLFSTANSEQGKQTKPNETKRNSYKKMKKQGKQQT